jgi:hypothetical protein
VLLDTELRRLAVRQQVPQQAVADVLAGIDLYDMPRGVFTEGGLLPGQHLRSLDALHIAQALRIQVDGSLIYDRRMREAAAAAGLMVLAPGDRSWPSSRSAER